MVEHPLEVLFTIFSKLPIRSLMRFKCVSKNWSGIIRGDPCFATMQMNNLNFEDMQVLFLLGHRRSCFIEPQNNDGFCVYEVDLDLADKSRVFTPYYMLVGSCNGLLLLDNFTDRVLLCNPLTQEMVTFPCPWSTFLEELYGGCHGFVKPPHERYASFGIGFDTLSRQYKMVQILSERRRVGDRLCYVNVAAKVANLEGIDLSWRETKNIPDFPVDHLYLQSMYVNRCLHWITRYNWRLGKRMVVFFLLDKEEFISMPLPNDSCDINLVEIGGFLGVFNVTSCSKINIWVRKELRGEWIKKYEISFAGKMLVDCDMTKVIGTWKNGEEVLLLISEKLFSYNKESDSLTPVEISGMKFYHNEIIPLRSTLTSISKLIQT